MQQRIRSHRLPATGIASDGGRGHSRKALFNQVIIRQKDIFRLPAAQGKVVCRPAANPGAEISQKAGIAKGTFYLYFKDKYDIRNKLISHEASKLFKNAVNALELHIKEQQISDPSFTITFTEEIIFIADNIINVLNTNQTLLTFISKNLSWGIFKEALTTNVADDDINFKDIYYEMLEDSGLNLNEPEIMLFMIVELISSTCYSSILYKEPADIDRLKPYLYKTIKAIINEHTIED